MPRQSFPVLIASANSTNVASPSNRTTESSSGIIEQVGPGRVRVHKPPEVRGWISRILGRLLGGDA